jgi:putative hydrolase
MSETPGDGPKNPFEGTPFEQLFGGGGLPGMPDLNALLGQVQAMMQPYDGAVNWTLATDLARKTVAQQPDPSPTSTQQSAVADAVRLADLWLDEASDFDSGVTSTAAWSRAEWIESTREVWQRLVEPIAEHVVGAMGSALPAEAKAMAGPFLGMLTQMGGAMFGSQIGTALGTLAGEVLSASDIGLPLGPTGRAALVPANVSAFAAGLDVSADDVLLYLALREAAHQRLFTHVPWLREHLLAAVADYGRGISIDTAGIEEQLRSLDPSNMADLQGALEGGLFEPKKTPAQEAALSRLETTLALVEGWVDEVVGQATHDRMPAAAKLQEAVRRRRAAGGPAEETFSALVGLELRPRRLRDASTLWGSLRTRQGIEARDAVWLHPDLLPTAADLDDPLGFREDVATPTEMSDADFDEALQKLLGEGGPDSTDPSGPDSPGA